ncbi:MAG TPA: L-serine ammonia-lyase, iron-sulfur-dependent subunit beta [Paenibacillus sp.]|nr:L-serine ammonia-lyase, iron-sulfur-dependent subunit beta [Paenibacillus sp.]
MRFKDVFSIIGPSMVGPSSSHTAGAARLGRVARQLLGEAPVRAEIVFYGSFADTYRGHGTDLAIVGGLLDWATDDLRIAQSLQHAEAAGLAVSIKAGKAVTAHPNTAKITLNGATRAVELLGASIGGGNIEVHAVDGFDVKFIAMYPTLCVYHKDRPGMLAEMTTALSRAGVNIGHMDVDRKGRNGEAMTVFEVDTPITGELLATLRQLQDVADVRLVDLEAGVGAS